METKIKKASTFYVHSHRKSEDVITSPKNEDQKFIDLSPNPRKKNQLKYITKTHLHEMKKLIIVIWCLDQGNKHCKSN